MVQIVTGINKPPVVEWAYLGRKFAQVVRFGDLISFAEEVFVERIQHCALGGPDREKCALVTREVL
jgi:hypothetical protein